MNSLPRDTLMLNFSSIWFALLLLVRQHPFIGMPYVNDTLVLVEAHAGARLGSHPCRDLACFCIIHFSMPMISSFSTIDASS
jgi:hypothetical protein